MTAVVFGFAKAGEATVAALTARSHDVVVVDDVASDERAARAGDLGAEWVGAPTAEQLDVVVRSADVVVPAPGVPEHHHLFDVAAMHGVEVVSEIELAYRWEQARPGGPRPMLAITGTDGKTTTTLMTVAMLRAAGVRTVDAGNTETPLIAALDLDLDAFVVECTSFRLAWTSRFRPDAAAWLNLAPDHLDWHQSIDTYIAAKAKIWDHQTAADVAVGFADDPVVMRHLGAAPARRRTFALSGADYHLRRDGDDGQLVGPGGRVITSRSRMRRSLPHDVTNALAASALVLESGLGDVDAIGDALAEFTGAPHRIELVGSENGVDWYNDSKATTPHAAAVAIAGFERVVLIAGGYDKRVDLSPMAADIDHVKAVIAIGDTRDRIAELFAAVPHVVRLDDLDAAVAHAANIAEPGDVVLLSPGCASFGLFANFEARGDQFRSLVATRIGRTTTSSPDDTAPPPTSPDTTSIESPPDTTPPGNAPTERPSPR